jgi:hypothetical protein
MPFPAVLQSGIMPAIFQAYNNYGPGGVPVVCGGRDSG